MQTLLNSEPMASTNAQLQAEGARFRLCSYRFSRASLLVVVCIASAIHVNTFPPLAVFRDMKYNFRYGKIATKAPNATVSFEWDDIVPERFQNYIVLQRNVWSVSIWGRGDNNNFCPDLAEGLDKSSRKSRATGKKYHLLMNISYESEALYKNANVGQGNWISGMYLMRLMAFQEGVDYMQWCPDAVANKANHILPWLNGYWPARDGNSTNPRSFPWPHLLPPRQWSFESQLCNNYKSKSCNGLAEMTPFVRYELRRMAIALVGIPHEGHPSAMWAEKYLWSGLETPDCMQLPNPAKEEQPVLPNVELDETTLHFRCEDLMGTNHPSFSFMKFSAFSKRIYEHTRSIGIVTNPFDGGQNRGGAGSRRAVKKACKEVALALHSFLAEKFPNARVSLRNGMNETVATAYARLVMANQTIVGASSFGIWPAMASFGRGYIRKPDYRKAPNSWALPLSYMYDDIELFEEPKRLPAAQASRMKGNQMELILKWFKDDSVNLN